MEITLKNNDLLRITKVYIAELGLDITNKDISIKLKAGRKHQHNNAIMVNIEDKEAKVGISQEQLDKELTEAGADLEEDTQLELPTDNNQSEIDAAIEAIIPDDPVEETDVEAGTNDDPDPNTNLFGTDANDVETDEAALEEAGENTLVEEESNSNDIFGD